MPTDLYFILDRIREECRQTSDETLAKEFEQVVKNLYFKLRLNGIIPLYP